MWWAHNIRRSYVLQPYTLVKDLRTEVQTTNARAVLDGDLDDFLKASLAHHYDDRRNRAYGNWAAVMD